MLYHHKFMVSVEGIEPSPHVPKTRTLPLRHTEKTGAAYRFALLTQEGILCRTITRRIKTGAPGLNRTDYLRVTNPAHRQQCFRSEIWWRIADSNRLLSLARAVCSQLALIPHGALSQIRTETARLLRPIPLPIGIRGHIGSTGRDRTSDQLVNSQLHYRCATVE